MSCFFSFAFSFGLVLCCAASHSFPSYNLSLAAPFLWARQPTSGMLYAQDCPFQFRVAFPFCGSLVSLQDILGHLALPLTWTAWERFVRQARCIFALPLSLSALISLMPRPLSRPSARTGGNMLWTALTSVLSGSLCFEL